MYENLMEEVVSPESYRKALKAVVANDGAPGVDGMTTKELSEHLLQHWPKIQAKLMEGAMADGVVVKSVEGTPQGGPLSPLLANIYLDALDRELERRGHAFSRYADDCNIYVGSQRSAERVMESVQGWIEKQLRLQVN